MNSFGSPLPKRLLLGFVLTPWVLCLWCLLDMRVVGLAPKGAYEWGVTALILWCLVLPTAYAAMFGLGWPALAFLRRRRVFSWVPILLAAGLIGAFALYVANVTLTGFQQWHWPGVERLVGKGALLGLEAGIVFCLIAGVPWRDRSPALSSP